jgi:ubiquinone/menaquinone biosynthesis C-methylase UbiE
MACLTAEQIAKLPPGTKVLEIGCGPKRVVPGSTAIDINPKSLADVIHDLNQTPWPFPDDSFDIVIAEHVIEHLDDVIRTTEEVHRILKPGGVWYVEVPHFSSHHHHTDPTHRHAFGARSFDYFVPAKGGVYTFHYALADFKKRMARLNGVKTSMLHRWLYKKANKNPTRYESELTWIFPLDSINFELEAIKTPAAAPARAEKQPSAQESKHVHAH